MTINLKHTVLCATALLLGLSSCKKNDSQDIDGIPGGRGEKTTVALTLSQAAAGATRAATGTEAPTPDESAITGNVRVVVFDAGGIFEKSISLPLTGQRTAAFEITAGNKYFYALANVPAGADTTTAANMTRAFYERKLQSVSVDSIARSGKFFMTNISSPSAQELVAGIDDPIARNQNIIKIPVGRAVAKVSMAFAPVTNTSGGTLSDLQYKMVNIPTTMYLIGQYESGQWKTPFFTNTFAAGNYVAPFSFASFSNPGYVLENMNETPLEGNTTMATIQARFTPTVLLSASGIVGGTPDADSTFYAGYKSDGTLKGFYNATPTDLDITTAVKYPRGFCFYKVFIADNTETVPSKKYGVARNFFYKVSITSVAGVGTSTEGELVIPTNPIVAETNMVAEITILPWSVVEQNTGI